ncbi:hypothetical protein [Staphylococcus epidermidis]|nr:hypothetical protein [Staphylococcus epidermidis]
MMEKIDLKKGEMEGEDEGRVGGFYDERERIEEEVEGGVIY